MRPVMLSLINMSLVASCLTLEAIIRVNTATSCYTLLRWNTARRLTWIKVIGRSVRLITRVTRSGWDVDLRVSIWEKQKALRSIRARALVPKRSFVRMLVLIRDVIRRISKTRLILIR